MSALRKTGGPGWYTVRRSLAGIEGPGRRTVTHLTLEHLEPSSDSDLRRLAGFRDLVGLMIRGGSAIDLRPLVATPVRGLILDHVENVDLRPVAGVASLENLVLLGLSAGAPPTELPPRLREFTAEVDNGNVSARVLERLVSSVRWDQADALRRVKLSLDPEHPEAPLNLDLAPLRARGSVKLTLRGITSI